MNRQQKYIWSKLFIVFALLFGSLQTMSQPDSVWVAYKMQFKKNVVELGNLYCWSDNNFFPGNLKLTTETNFYSDFENHRPGIFQDISANAEDFYLFLDSLNNNEKQHLIRYFSFLEKYFDTAFESAQLPPDFKYLAPAFSAMNQNLIEPKSKAGIWQLNHFQAVLNGLQINQLVDERFNPWLSTQAFASEMKQNLSLFSSPELAVLAYVYGKAKLKNALAFAGEAATLTQILVYLPESANHLISNFQAITVFLKVNRFYPKNEPLAKIVQSDTVKITKQVHFKQISFVLGIAQEELGFLNPQFRFMIVPKSGKSSKLAVPNGYWDDFVLWQDSVYNTFDSTLFNITVQKIEYPPAPDRQYAGEPVKNLQIEGKTKIKYTLQTGDVLGIIAEKYDVKVADLKYWNNISNERRIQAGKTLDIFIDNDQVEYYSGLQKSNKQIETKSEIVNQFSSGSPLASYQPKNKGRKVEHTVRSGESPFTIAKKYEGVTPEDILIWNNIKDARKIQIGQKLIVYEK